jgi:hypothetical protein
MPLYTKVLTRLAGFLPSRDALGVAGRWGRRILLAALLVVACLGSLEVKRRVEADERLRLDRWTVDVADLPDWVTPEIREEIGSIDLSSGGRPLCLWEPGVLDAVKGTIERSPWIREVTRLAVSYPTSDRPGAMDIGLRLRSPAALVEHGGLYYLTDSDGVRLGAPYREAPSQWFRIPAIVNVPRTDLPPPEGERWSSRDVLQGIAVARVLHEGGLFRDFPGCPVDRIDLVNLHGRVNPRSEEIVLWTGDKQLRWGRSPISSGARVVPVEDLLAHLREVLSRPEAYAAYRVIHLDGLRGRATGSSG